MEMFAKTSTRVVGPWLTTAPMHVFDRTSVPFAAPPTAAPRVDANQGNKRITNQVDVMALPGLHAWSPPV
jgi:hypothetical protein